MIPLNEYPKEELKSLYYDLSRIDRNIDGFGWASSSRSKWKDRIKEAISDQEFKEKQLPFNEPSK